MNRDASLRQIVWLFIELHRLDRIDGVFLLRRADFKHQFGGRNLGELAAGLRHSAPLTIKGAKLVLEALMLDMAQQRHASIQAVMDEAMSSADYKEGVAAFAEILADPRRGPVNGPVLAPFSWTNQGEKLARVLVAAARSRRSATTSACP